MPKTKSYYIPLRPIPWQRAGLNGKKFFDKQAQEKNAYGLYLAQQHDGERLFDKPIKVEIVFVFAKPRFTKRLITLYHSSAPDIDNCVKFCFDAMKDVVFTDDRIVASLTAKKVYDSHGRTEIIITEID